MATTETSSSSNPPPANKLVMIKNAVHDFLHEKNSFTYIFELAEKYTKLQREYIFLGKYFCARPDWIFLVIWICLCIS